MMKHIKDKVVLVTGGCGSIGSELVKQCIKNGAKTVKVLDNDETGLFNLSQELKEYSNVRYILGDIRDKHRLNRAAIKTDILFHAAALKHVPLCEYNPLEAVTTNIIGTNNVIEAARDQDVEKVISISTDKAVTPVNTMGATKLLSEKLILNGDMYGFRTKYALVRFGNVLNSRGSVIPLFHDQIKKGGPVTITSEKMTRFIMSISQAVDLVLQSAGLMEGSDMFILKMNALNIIDLATAMVRFFSPTKEIPISITGIRPGEKLYEALISEDESIRVEDQGTMFRIKHELFIPHHKDSPTNKSSIPLEQYHSAHSPKLSVSEIMELLREEFKDVQE